MNDSITLSIILPVHNGMPHLPESVQSIVEQSYTHWELIVVNDGSTDSSGEYLEKLTETDGRIRCVTHAVNRGVAAAYNTGIRRACGQILAFQEQDDISVPHRFERQLNLIQRYSVPFVSSRVGWMDANGSIYRYWPDDIPQEVEIWLPGNDCFEKLLVHQTRIANATTMLNRALIKDDDLVFDEQFKQSGQDWDFHLRMVRKYSVLRLQEPLVWMRRYRGHISSTTGKAQVFQDNRRLLSKHARLELWSQRRFFKSPVFLKAWSNEFAIEARYYRNAYGVLLGCLGLLCWPRNPQVWASVWNALKRLTPRGV